MGAWIMAGVTFREAARKKVLWMALVAGVAFITMFGFGLYFQLRGITQRMNPLLAHEAISGFLMVGLYAVDSLAVVMTVLTSVDTLSGEISSGTIQAIATKPIPRWEVLLGKWMGFVLMITLYIILMVGGITVVTYAMSVHYLAAVLPRNILSGVSLIWLECILVLSLTFLFGTTLSTLTNGVLALGFHGLAFIGGWIEQVAAITHSPHAVDVGIAASVIMPSESLWRRAVFEMQSPILGGIQFTPFSNASVPSLMMVAYAVVYLAAAMFLALRRFARRDL